MDEFSRACVHRARSALDLFMGDAPAPRETVLAANVRSFLDIARTFAASDKSANAVSALRGHPDAAVQKAAAHSLADDFWQTGEAAALASSYVESIAERSLLDMLAEYASRVSISTRGVLIASDSVADVVAEGFPKPVRRIALSLGDVEPRKAVGIVVCTRELLNETGRSLFERELERAVLRAANQAVIAGYLDSNTLTVPGTGDPLEDLRAGLRAAGPSDGYVVAASTGYTADLATRQEAGPGFTVRGGQFRPGVHIVAVDSFAGLLVIPASRAALWLGGLELRSSGQGDVDMRDSPESPASLVNLWQTNSVGLIAERHWHLAQAEGAVLVEEGSP